MPPFRSVLKARAVEDPVNVYIERPLAYAFVKGVFRTRLTPNGVTLLAILCGVLAGVMFVWGVPYAMVAGGALMWASSIFDGADGILARAKNLQSEFGRALDGAGDAIVAVFTVFPAFYHIWVTNHDPRQVVLMVVALATTIVHLVAYDFYKESYLRATQPGRGGEGQDADEIAETVEAAASEGAIIQLAMKYVLVPHLRRQKAIIHWFNPEAWRLRQLLQSNDQTVEIYGKTNFWPMQLWALLSLSPHTYLMAICAMLDRLDVYLFIRVFVMNGIFLAAVIWQRHATCRTIERLARVGAIEVSEPEQPYAM